MTTPEIVTIKDRKLVGMKIRTSLAENRTFELWSRFKPKVKEIADQKNSGYYSVQIFDEDLEFDRFTPQTFFEKWAAVEVGSFKNIPQDCEPYILSGGKYAVFIHKGPASEFPKTSQYIFGEWIPKSDFEVDNRPHFEIMGENYQPDHPDSEEEIWIPIQQKK